MRRLILTALALLLLPGVVVWRQYETTYRDEGGRADYLEIEEPPRLRSDQPELQDGGIPILCYHYLRGRPGPLYFARVLGAVLFNLPTLQDREYWSTPVEVFASHLAWLDENGYSAITLDELAGILDGRAAGPDRPVVITFDDGDRSVKDLALPLLQEHGMVATLFVVTSQVGRKWEDVDGMDWDDLRALQATGLFQVESHSHAMHYKVKGPRGRMRPVFLDKVPGGGGADAAGEAWVRRDLRASRDALQRELGRPARWLAWPYGWANDDLDRLAAGEGYAGSVSLAAGANVPGRDRPWHLSRLTISARTTTRVFQEMMQTLQSEGTAIAARRSGP